MPQHSADVAMDAAVAGAVVTPGNHDGVHLGHRALLRRASERAAPEGLEVIVLTFDPHPAMLLAPERAPTPLTTLPRRVALLKALGADRVVVRTFDRTFAAQSPEAFMRDVLVADLGTRAVVVGPDFRFGRGREGDEDTLRRYGAQRGFDVHAVPPVTVDGARVSSTRIRRHLDAGDVGLAASLLGRVHDVAGTVVEGDRRGRALGFPTANLDCEPVLIPADGVYAVVARPEGGPLLHGVANLGVRPTFDAGRSVEVHLFDFDGDLYGQTVRVGFVARLRGERKFDGLEALVAQIGADAEVGRARLAEADEGSWRWI
jgi:riboflavin kinase/FMN adenylyltransferase